MDGLENYTKNDRFELLSAYMDGEVNLEERKLVETWIDTDPEIQRQYKAFISLGQSLQSLPMETASSKSVEDTLDAVFERVDRRPRMWKRAGVGTAIAAALGALGALLAGDLSPQFAAQKGTTQTPTSGISLLKSPSQTTQVTNSEIQPIEAESLMLALEAPPIDIPNVDASDF